MAAGVLTQQILDRVRLRIGEITPAMILDAEIALFITEAQRDMVWRLPDPALWSVTSITTTAIGAGDDFYLFEAADNAANDFVREISVQWKATYAKRWEVGHLGKLSGPTDLEATDTNPFYLIEALGIKFIVGTVTAAANFIITYIQLPADIDIGAGSVEPELTQMFFPAIEDYVVSRCLESRLEPQESDKAFIAYLDKCASIENSYVEGRDVGIYQKAGGRQ